MSIHFMNAMASRPQVPLIFSYSHTYTNLSHHVEPSKLHNLYLVNDLYSLLPHICVLVALVYPVQPFCGIRIKQKFTSSSSYVQPLYRAPQIPNPSNQRFLPPS